MIAKEGSKGGEAEADKGKSYLTPGEKRKVAFIKKDVSGALSFFPCLAYCLSVR
jgi:hypothetical protein